MKKLTLTTLLTLTCLGIEADSQVIYGLKNFEISKDAKAYIHHTLKNKCPKFYNDSRFMEVEAVKVNVDEIDQGITDTYYQVDIEATFPRHEDNEEWLRIKFVESSDGYRANIPFSRMMLEDIIFSDYCEL